MKSLLFYALGPLVFASVATVLLYFAQRGARARYERGEISEDAYKTYSKKYFRWREYVYFFGIFGFSYTLLCDFFQVERFVGLVANIGSIIVIRRVRWKRGFTLA